MIVRMITLFSFLILISNILNAQLFKVTEQGIILVRDSVTDQKLTDTVFTNFKTSGRKVWDNFWLDHNNGKYFQPVIESDSIIVAEAKNRWGCISTSGRIILPFSSYLPVYLFGNGAYYGIVENVDNIFHIEEEVYAIKDWKGTTTTMFGGFTDHFSNAFLMNGLKSEYFGLINSNLDTLLPFEYQCTSWDNKNFGFSENGLVALQNKENKCGIVNYKGEIVLPFEYDYIDDVYGIATIVEKDSLYGLVDSSGRLVVPIEYQNISIRIFDCVVAAILYKDSTYYLLDSDYQIHEETFDQLYFGNANCDNVIFERNGKYGVYNVGKKTFLKPAMYDTISIYYNSGSENNSDVRILTCRNNEYGLFDSDGNTVLDMKQTRIIPVENASFLIAFINGKQYYMNENGQILSGPFDEIDRSKQTTFDDKTKTYSFYFRVRIKDKTGWIGPDGTILIPVEYDETDSNIWTFDYNTYTSRDRIVMRKNKTISVFGLDGNLLSKEKAEKGKHLSEY